MCGLPNNHSKIKPAAEGANMPMRTHLGIARLLFLMICIPLSFLPSTLFGQRTKPQRVLPITNEDLRTYALYADVLLAGRIVNAQTEPSDNSIGNGRKWPADHPMVVTKLDIIIDQLIAGDYEGKTIEVYLNEGQFGEWNIVSGHNPAPQLHPGDSIVVALLYNPKSGRYVREWESAFFAIQNGDLIPFEIEYFVQIQHYMQIFEEAARERSFPYLYANADIACIGTVIENDRSNCLLSVSLDSLLRGSPAGETFVVNYKGGFDIQSTNGTKLLLFLKRTPSELRLFSGMNSIYEVFGNKLVRHRRLQLTATLDKIRWTLKSQPERENND